MGCLAIDITTAAPASLAVSHGDGPVAAVTAESPQTSLSVRAVGATAAAVITGASPSLGVTPPQAAVLTVGEARPVGMSLHVTPAVPALLAVTTPHGASAAVAAVGQRPALAVQSGDRAEATVTTGEQTSLDVTTQQGVSLAIGEVCTASGGTIVVLAASDGPLRTKDGGYFLLNPDTNPPEN